MSANETQQTGGSAGPNADVQVLANFLSSLYKRDLIKKPSTFCVGNAIDAHLLSVLYLKKLK